MARYLYIVSSEASYDQLYEEIRRDMGIGSVEVTLNRRRTVRRQRAESQGERERRRTDRRRHHVDDELARVGWARVQVE